MANKTERDIVFPMLLKKRNVGGGGSKYDVDKLRAGIYLLGVEDATEKKLWCGYDLFKTLTLNEIVYVFLKIKHIKNLILARLSLLWIN